MGDTSDDFVTQFHQLEGNSVGERKKNFFKLLRKNNLFANEEQLNRALQTLQPKTYLESIFWIETLIYFKRTSELLEVLKGGNEVFISKIIKQPWFFKEAFKDIDAEKLVNEFLPCMSFTIRMKILKRLTLSLNEGHMDEVFDNVLKRYGVFIATRILHACSSTKIVKILSDNEIKLRPNQVKFLFDKDFYTFKAYLEHYKSITRCSYDNANVFKHIALKNPKMLLDLKKNEKLSSSQLGYRTTKKIIDVAKDDIAKDVEYYAKFLKCNIVVRKLHGSFKNVYLNLFPKKMEDVNAYNFCHQLLLFFPKKHQWNLFAQTFSHVFENKSLLDNLKHFDYSLMQLCPDKELIQTWAEMRYKLENNNDFLKYFEVTKAVSIIKEKINVTSKMYDRATLLNLMSDTCEQNKDLDALEKVLDYFCFRHRNETTYVRQGFLGHIRSIFKPELFTEKHWASISEQMKLLRIKEEYNYTYDLLVKKYLEFLFKNGKPFREEIIQYSEYVISQGGSFCPGLENPPIEKEILIQIINVMPDVISSDHKDYKLIQVQLLLDTIRFNKNNDYCINLFDFPNLINYFKSILDKTTKFDEKECEIVNNLLIYSTKFPQNTIIEKAKLFEIILTVTTHLTFPFEDAIINTVTKKNRSELENELLQFYFDKIVNKYASPTITLWFLKNEPITLYSHIDKIIRSRYNIAPHTYRKINDINVLLFKEIRLYSHFNFDTKYIEYYKKQLNNADCDGKEYIIKYLSNLLSTEHFVKLVEQYLPKKKKLDLQDKEMEKVYKLQCAVAKLLKGVMEPFKMLPTVIKFCVGDYLQSVLPSVYSIFYRSPEKQLYLYVDSLSKKAVSIRKHALFLSCALLDYNYTITMLKTVDHKNVSSQKHIFTATLGYFLRNPSQDLLDLVGTSMHTIDKNDTESLGSLTVVYKVPNKYKSVYIEKCWQFFEDIQKQEVKISYLQTLLLQSLTTDILEKLSSEFCKNIISSYFKPLTSDGLLNMELFTCHVLRYRTTEQLENFNYVFEIISEFKNNNEIQYIKTFFEKFYAVASEEINNNFVKMFGEYWNRLFTPLEMFDEFVLLKLLILRSDSVAPFSENYAKNVVTFLEQLIGDYTLFVYNKFKGLLNKALDSDFEKKKDKYLFFYDILKFKVTTVNCMLVLDIMNKVDKDDPEDVSKVFHDIMQIIKEFKEPVVELYYKSYTT